MNLLSLFYLITAVFSLVFGTYVYMLDKRNKVNILFLWFAINGFYWGFTGFGLRQADSYELAYLWQKIGSFWPFAIAALFHFSIVYSGLTKRIKRIFLFFIIYFPAFIFSLFELVTDQVTIVKNVSWGWTTDVPSLTIPYVTSTFWSLVIAFTAIGLTFVYYMNERNRKKRKRTGLVLLALFIPVSLSALSETVIPLLGITAIKLTVPGYILCLTIIGLAMWKYELFSINPYSAAENIVETMPDLLILSSLKGKIKMVNQSVLDELNYSRMELLKNKKIMNFTSLDKRRILGQNKFKSYETTFYKKNKETIPILLSKSIIFDNAKKPVGFVFIGKNISELKETEDKLKQLNKNLDKKVKDRTLEIERLLDEKDTIIHILSHDLKNPLGPLLNLLPVAKNRVKDEKVEKIIDVCLKNSEKIKTMITETVQLSRRTEKNSSSFEQVNLKRLIDSIVMDNKNLLEDNNFMLENKVDERTNISADRFQLGEVFSNLLSNAVKYTPDDKQGVICIDAIRKDEEIMVSFSDNGSGMTENQIDRIFEKFYHTGDSRKGMDSSGLGLAICKRIVEKHGGTIWAESKGVGKGSTFYFTLPLKESNSFNNTQSFSHSYRDVTKKVDRLLAEN